MESCVLFWFVCIHRRRSVVTPQLLERSIPEHPKPIQLLLSHPLVYAGQLREVGNLKQ